MQSIIGTALQEEKAISPLENIFLKRTEGIFANTAEIEDILFKIKD
jgi:hypothetical protein